MVPDLARWQIRAEGVLLFKASERPLNHPGVTLDDPMCPKLEPGAHRDGQFPSFYVKWWNLTVPKCTRLEFWTHRIVQIDPRVVPGPFRGSESSIPSARICHLAGSGTIWVKMVPSPKHGELFSEMVLWLWPVHGLAGSGVKSAPEAQKTA